MCERRKRAESYRKMGKDSADSERKGSTDRKKRRRGCKSQRDEGLTHTGIPLKYEKPGSHVKKEVVELNTNQLLIPDVLTL